MEDKIFITMEEYKELLIIKGKYEELKSLHEPAKLNWNPYREYKFDKVFCSNTTNQDEK